MKHIFRILAVAVCILGFSQNASAKGFTLIPYEYQTGKIECIKELPQDYKVNNVHVDLGIEHCQFSLFWVFPVWNSKAKLVLYHKINDEEYYSFELSESDLETLRSKYSDIPESPSLPFWDRMGGKLSLCGIIWALLMLGVKLHRKKNDDDDDD